MIEVSHLTKRYGMHEAIRDLTFTIPEGKVHGLLGPNGAGKSTTMNIMAGCLASTDGTVTIGGYDIFKKPIQAKRLLGYLPEQPPLYADMTVDDYLAFVARAKGTDEKLISAQTEQVQQLCGTREVSGRMIRNLSKGYRQRVGIAQALLGDPKVIMLDEPTVGLDPLQMIEIRDLIRALGKERTVILSSHILSEVRAVCDSVLILSQGRLVASDTSENLEKLMNGTFAMELLVQATEQEARRIAGSISCMEEIRYEPAGEGYGRLVLRARDANDFSAAVFFAFCDARKAIIRMNVVQSSLEDVFIELTGAHDTQPGEGENA